MENAWLSFFEDFEKFVLCSEGQEKYLRELSITPVGYFTGGIKKSLPCG
jgi:hypothetical protein